MKPDVHACEDASYDVISLYFDTPSYTCVMEKEGGYYNRFKYRLQTYNTGGMYNLELKEKKGSTCLKTIKPLDEGTEFSLIDGAVLPPNKIAGIDNFYSLRRSSLLKPAVVVHYKRTA